MCEGYDPPLKDDHPHLEDELLCEYVDGTMDPVVREVFDEYLLANPDLRNHVECLRSTRMLLCHYGCRCRAPRDLHDRLRRQLTCDLVNGKVPFHILVADRLKGATVTSAMAIVLVLGLVGGFSMMQDGQLGPSVASTAVVTSSSINGVTNYSQRAPAVPLPQFSPRVSSMEPLPASLSFVTQQPNASRRILVLNPKTDTSVTLALVESSLLP